MIFSYFKGVPPQMGAIRKSDLTTKVGHRIFFLKFKNWVAGILCNSQNKKQSQENSFFVSGVLDTHT